MMDAQVPASVVFLATALLAFPGLPARAQPLTVEPVASGFDQPTFVAAPPNDPRLFVLERPGRIVTWTADVSEVLLDISDQVSSLGEGGLLGLAFAPDFAATGVYYIYYTRPGPDASHPLTSVVSRIRAGPTEEIVLTVDQPFANHNGGTVAFRPHADPASAPHFLYVGLGDGGSAGDPGDVAQDPQDLLGKLLRLDVGVPPEPDSLPTGAGYAIPADNPFVGDAGARDEIWALGLRNPFRFSFDRHTRDLWIGDVGQGAREEVDFEEAVDPLAGGANYGWDVREGTACFDPDPGEPTCADPGGVLTDPIHEYLHAGPSPSRSITGGVVYRGAIPQIRGLYFFADYITGQIWSLERTPGGAVVTPRSAELGAAAAPFQIVAFGEDGFGELYLVHLGAGMLYRVRSSEADADGAPDSADNCSALANGPLLRDPGGNVQLDSDADGYGNRCDADYDGSGVVGAFDFNILRLAFDSARDEPAYVAEADCDGDGFIGGSDLDCLRRGLGEAPGPSGLACAGSPPCP